MSYSNNNKDNNMQTSAGTMDMVQCQDCGHWVPATNMAIHQVRGCPAAREELERRRHGRPVPQEDHGGVAAAAAVNNDNDEATAAVTTRRNRPMIEQTAAAHNSSSKAPPNWIDPPRRTPDPHTQSSTTTTNEEEDRKPAAREEGEDGIVDLPDDIDIPDHTDSTDNDQDDSAITAPAASSATASAAAAAAVAEDTEPFWPCPRCTLHNAINQSTCDACGGSRPSEYRPPDPVRRERLIGGPSNDSPSSSCDNTMSNNHNNNRENSTNNTNNDDENNDNSSQQGMGYSWSIGGAVLGGLAGAARAWIHNRPVASGALQGAMTGALGGALAEQVVMRAQDASGPDDPDERETLLPGGPPVVRTVRRIGPHGGSITITTMRSTGNRNEMDPMRDLLLEQWLQSMFMTGHVHHVPRGRHPFINVDGMSYEQLLAAFGDGTDHLRGATEEEIRALPVSTIDAASMASAEEGHQCMICLEEYQLGDECKTLPCWHKFHTACIDKWLSSRASCPICKHPVGSSGNRENPS